MKEAWALIVVFAVAVCFILWAHNTEVQQRAAQIQDIPEPPDFESIEIKDGWLEVIDEGRRRSKYRINSIVEITHWKPGQHPERRPWDAIALQIGNKSVRIDCKEGDDADKIYELTTGFQDDSP